jgi:hypothetical protein
MDNMAIPTNISINVNPALEDNINELIFLLRPFKGGVNPLSICEFWLNLFGNRWEKPFKGLSHVLGRKHSVKILPIAVNVHGRTEILESCLLDT